jgi:hypothetical protein
MPLYDCEKIIFDSLFAYGNTHSKKHLEIKKATGLGISEFMLISRSQTCLRIFQNRDYHLLPKELVFAPTVDVVLTYRCEGPE